MTEMTLVLGGTGKTGRRVVDRLAARGVPVRIGSRSGAPPFDWEDVATWPAAVDGVTAVYVCYVPDVGFRGAADAVGAFTERAVGAGVRRLVLLSGRGEDGARAVEPFVDADDIADVAVAALTAPGHDGRVHELTGPRLLTFADAVATIAAATGRPIRYLPVSGGDYRDLLVGHGVPPAYATQLTDLFAEVLDGRNASVASGVRDVLGREPRDFADYARATAATGVWEGGAR